MNEDFLNTNYTVDSADFATTIEGTANSACINENFDLSIGNQNDKHQATTNSITEVPEAVKVNEVHSQYFFDVEDGLFTPIDDQFLSNRKHKEIKSELVEGSGISPDQLKLNFFYVDSLETIRSFINWKKYTHVPGWVHVSALVDSSCDSTITCFKPNDVFETTKAKEDGTKEQLKYICRSNDPLDESLPNYEELREAQKLETNRPRLPRISVSSFEKMKVNFPNKFAGYTLVASAEGEAIGLWQYIQSKSDIPIIKAEGAKKAESLISAGYPAVIIAGCNMTQIRKDVSGKSILGPWYKDWCKAGKRTWFMAFDGDNQSNIKVAKGLCKIIHLLESHAKQSVKVISWLGLKDKDDQQLKGIDDVIGCHGEGIVKGLLESAEPFRQWLNFHPFKPQLDRLIKFEKSTAEPKPDKPECPSVTELAEQLYKDRFKYSLKFIDQWGQFYYYGTKTDISIGKTIDDLSGDSWYFIPAYRLKQVVTDWLEENDFIPPSEKYQEKVITALQNKCSARPKEAEQFATNMEPMRYLSFSNGVLDVKSGAFNPHNPKYITLFAYPFPYTPIKRKPDQTLADFFWSELNKVPELIVLRDFLLQTQAGNKHDVVVLLAIQKAYIRQWLSKLHKFILITGKAGTAKSTYSNFLGMALDPNFMDRIQDHPLIMNTNFQQVTDDRQTRIIALNRKAIHIAEVENITKDQQDLVKKLASKGRFTERGLYKEEGVDYIYEGNIVITSNSNPFKSQSDGINRRKLHITFEQKVTNIIEDFEIVKLGPCIPHLLNILLPDENMSFDDCKEILNSGGSEQNIWNIRYGASSEDNTPENDFIKSYLEIADPSDGAYISVKELMEKFTELNPKSNLTRPDSFANKLEQVFKEKYQAFGWENVARVRSAEAHKAKIPGGLASFTNIRWRSLESDQPDFDFLSGLAMDRKIDPKTPAYKLSNVLLERQMMHTPAEVTAEVVATVAPEPEVLPEPKVLPEPEAVLVAPEPVAVGVVEVLPEPEPAPKAELPAEPVVNNTGESLEDLTDHYRLFLKTIWMDQAEYHDDPCTTKLYEFKSKLVIPQDLDKFDVSAYLGEVRSEADQFPTLYPELAGLLESAEPADKERVKVLVKELSTAHSITNSTQLKKFIRTISTKPGKWIDAIRKNCKKGK